MQKSYSNLYDQVQKFGLLLQETILYNLGYREKTKILFSKAPVQEENLRKGLRFTKNIELEFNEFKEERISNADLVIPLTIPDLKKLCETRHLVKSNKIPIPTLESIDICDDKYLFYQTLQSKGFETFLPKIATNLPYPYILKKKITERGVDNYIISDDKVEQKYKDFIASPEYFCQELVLGKKEYATHILFRDKKIVASLNVEYIFATEFPIKGQDEIVGRRIVASPFNDLFAEILSAIGFEGICCFNYKEVGRKPLLIEINPRFGASLSLYFISFLRKL
jgi:predicted ATP-grasp superfamily ATP-dependent carboligase